MNSYRIDLIKDWSRDMVWMLLLLWKKEGVGSQEVMVTNEKNHRYDYQKNYQNLFAQIYISN